MQLYDATVRLSGNPMQEVPKQNLTAPEVMLLQKIHGGVDAVVRIAKRKMDKRSHGEERARLGALYGDQQVFSLFGPDHTKLPVKLDNIEFVDDDELSDDDLDALTAPDVK